MSLFFHIKIHHLIAHQVQQTTLFTQIKRQNPCKFYFKLNFIFFFCFKNFLFILCILKINYLSHFHFILFSSFDNRHFTKTNNNNNNCEPIATCSNNNQPKISFSTVTTEDNKTVEPAMGIKEHDIDATMIKRKSFHRFFFLILYFDVVKINRVHLFSFFFLTKFQF